MYIGGMMLNSYISISKNRLFVWSMVLILLLAIVIHMLFFENFSRYVLKNDRSLKTFEHIKKEGKHIKIAVIGTSHTGDSMQLSEPYFFNYARSGTWNPMVAYAKVSHLLAYAPNLKVLVLEVDHISLLAYDSTLHNVTPEQYLYLLKHVEKPLYEINRLHVEDGTTTWLLSLQADVAAVIHRKYLQSYLMGRGKKKEKVSAWSTLTPKEKIQSAKKRTHSYRIDTASKVDNAVYDYYLKAIREAKRKGVKVYLLFNPQTKEYFDQINVKNHKIVDDFVSVLANEENVTVLDYRHYFAEDDSFFENQDHVNKKGAKVLMQDVMRVIGNEF